MTRDFLTALLGVCPLMPFAAGAHAQDSHYWAEQFGARATLLGSVLIGSLRLDELGDHQLTYSLLLRQQFDTTVTV